MRKLTKFKTIKILRKLKIKGGGKLKVSAKEVKSKRRGTLKRRRNFFPTLILIILLLAGTIFVIFFVDPESKRALQAFFLSLALTLIFTLSFLFTNTRRGVFATLGILSFLLLRYFGIGNILNFLLVSAIVTTAELYFSRN